jgi:V8-like Glu-specific endopeptidase
VALRLESDRSVCGATAVGPDMIETAAHCLQFPLESINGQPARIVRSMAVGQDRIRVVVAGIRFARWAQLASPVVTERVRWWGQPMGVAFVYREGVVSWISDDRKAIAVDGTICHGDSGSGLFNDRGELVGVVSAMSSETGCTFLVAH